MRKILNIIFILIIVIMTIIVVRMCYTDFVGQKRCDEYNGNWIYLNGERRCVDDDFNEVFNN